MARIGPSAVARLAGALEGRWLPGPKTNAAFLHALALHPGFAAGQMDTGLIGRELAQLAPAGIDPRAVAFGVTHLLWHAHDEVEAQRNASETYSPWSAQDAFQLGGPRRQQVTVLVDGTPTKIDVGMGTAGPRAEVVAGEGERKGGPRAACA